MVGLCTKCKFRTSSASMLLAVTNGNATQKLDREG